MDWVEFFFGWLTKGQYETSLLDSIMCFIELVLLMGIIGYVANKKNK